MVSSTLLSRTSVRDRVLFLVHFLFSTVISPLVDELRAKGLGLRLGTLLIPGLFYADDIILFASNPAELRAILNYATIFSDDGVLL